MMLAIADLLSPGQAQALCEAAQDVEFGDGAATAGALARGVKANDQATPTPERDGILAQVRRALAAHPLFQSAARPRAVSPLILSRYRVGQTYGLHVDDAMMQGLRTDLSFTLFLSDPESYDGGALVIEDRFEARAVRLPAGSLFLYPSTTLHRVDPLTRGTRLAVIGWVQSLIRDGGQREILFDLDQAIAQALAAQGKSPLVDTLAKTRSNLLRLWAEP